MSRHHQCGSRPSTYVGDVSLRANDPILRVLAELDVVVFCEGVPTDKRKCSSNGPAGHGQLTENTGGPQALAQLYSLEDSQLPKRKILYT